MALKAPSAEVMEITVMLFGTPDVSIVVPVADRFAVRGMRGARVARSASVGLASFATPFHTALSFDSALR